MDITYDNSLSFTVISGSSTTVNYTVGVGEGRILLVNTGPGVTAITFNGVSLDNVINFTPSIIDGNEQRLKVWRLISPDEGTHTLAFTLPAGNEIIGAVSYLGVNVDDYQPIENASGYSNNGISNTQVALLATSLTTTIDNSLVVMFTRGGGNFPQTFTAGTGTLRLSAQSILSNAFAIIDSGTQITPEGSSTLQADWTAASGFMSNVIFSLSPGTKQGGMLPFFL